MRPLASRLATLGVIAAAAATGGCTDFLAVENPGEVNVESLGDSTNAGLVVNGAVGRFQEMVGVAALYGGVLADESRSAHANVSFGPIDRRDFNELNDVLFSTIYPPFQRARFAADTSAQLLKSYLGADAAARDVRVARMLAFAGYGHLYLGEQFCTAPIGRGAPLTPAQLFDTAAVRFDEAIAIARAVKGTATTTNTPADSVLGLALVGAARNALNLNDKVKAAGYATAVPAAFEYRAYFAEGIPPQAGLAANPLWNGMGSPEPVRTGFNTNASGGINYSQAALWVVVDSAFEAVRDPRMPISPTRVNTMVTAQPGFVANKARSFGGYVAPTAALPGGAPMTPGASIRVASGLEARYILAETDNGGAATRTFVDAQRAANAQTVSTAATPAAVLADLRDQKRREFYLDGRRLGEIRRYKAQYSVDFFPRGAGYGAVECFPIPITELNDNPNIPR